MQPALSPDGGAIVFRSERDGGGLFVMGGTGESVRRLTSEGHYPSWSPDGLEVVYCTDTFSDPTSRFAVPSQIWAVSLATGDRRLITAGDTVQPAVSPDGRWIAYWGLLYGGGQRDLAMVPAGGGPAIALTQDSAVDWNPVWSPDGRYLYYLSDRGGSMNVWRLAIDSASGAQQGEPQPVTTPSTRTRHLAFSRDGRYMVYAQAASRTNIRRLTLDASLNIEGGPISITRGERRTTNPALSPDGRWLAFDSIGYPQEDLFIAASDGTGERQLTDDEFRDRGPRWSPDGRRIAFLSDRSGRFEIWTLNPDGSGLRQLTDTTGPAAQQPVWSPDGRRIAYSRTVAPVALIQVNDPDRPRQLRSLKPFSDP